MSEMRKGPLQSGLNELEKIFQEYKSKLEDAEQEANEILDVAWRKAETIIADKQKEAQQIVDEMKQKARQEADRIVLEAKHKAAEVEKEAEEKTRRDAKDRAKREVERILDETRQNAEKQSAVIIEQAQKEAEEIVKKARESAQTQVFDESEAIIAEAKEKSRRVDEDSMARAAETHKLILEVSQRADDVFNQFKTQVQGELTDLAAKLAKTRDNLEMRMILDKKEVSAHDKDTTSDNGHFKGRRELNIGQPYDRSQIKKLIAALRQIPGVKLDGEAGGEDNFSIYLNIVEPIPLPDILQELSLVDSSDVRGDTITLTLKPGNNDT